MTNPQHRSARPALRGRSPFMGKGLGTKPRRRFGANYLEHARLRDGRSVRFLAVRPSDGSKLLEGFQRLSPESRYARFLLPKSELTAEELRYFTHLDGELHYALYAEVATDGGWDYAGVVRFVQDPGEPGHVDIAVTVLDEYQGSGLGTRLVDRILAAAAERGYRAAVADVLADNLAMLTVFKRLVPQMRRVSYQGGVIHLFMPLNSYRPTLTTGEGWRPRPWPVA